MKKVIVFQHVAHKILGTLNPTLKKKGLRIRYINFDRTPEENPSIEKYDALIILGGHMGVYESERYTHIKTECKIIEEALKKEIPILGICLGSQLIAHVLGSEVKKHHTREIGWCEVEFNEQALNDPLFSHFNRHEKIFQLHGDTFAIPNSATQLAQSKICPSQAFKYKNAYGLQFHLEVDLHMITRWLSYEQNLKDIKECLGENAIEVILKDTQIYLERSLDLSLETFRKFTDIITPKDKGILLGSNEFKKFH